MIYKLTTVDTVISQIVRDLDIGDREVPVYDFIEWIAEALKHIGCYYQFTEKSTCIDIEDYKGELPCDFYQLIRITRSGEYLVNNQTIVDCEEQIKYNQITNSDLNITHNTLTVSFKCGKLWLLYLAFPIDDNGFPMIPDDISYFDAMFWRVCYKLSMRGFEFKNPKLKDIDYTKDKWNFYCKQARANGNMPDPDMLERLKNNFLRLIPDENQYAKKFQTNGWKENINLRGRE